MNVQIAEDERGTCGVEQKSDRRRDDQAFHDTAPPIAPIEDDRGKDVNQLADSHEDQRDVRRDEDEWDLNQVQQKPQADAAPDFSLL